MTEPAPSHASKAVPPGASNPGQFLGGASRPATACAAVVFGLIAAWMWYIASNFPGVNGWFEKVVGLVVDELILAAGLFAVLFLIWAVFAPARVPRFLMGAQRALTRSAARFGLLLGLVFGAAILFVYVEYALKFLGIG